MRFEVLLTEDAARDLEEIYGCINEHNDPGRAIHVLEPLEAAIEGLAINPVRGPYLKELVVLGVRVYRQGFFKPYE